MHAALPFLDNHFHGYQYLFKNVKKCSDIIEIMAIQVKLPMGIDTRSQKQSIADTSMPGKYVETLRSDNTENTKT